MTAVTQGSSRAYETVFILKPSLADEEVAGEVEKVKAIVVQKAGEIVWVETIGKKKLAYEIQKERRGIFILLQFKGSQKTVAELQRAWRLQDMVMRFMTVKIKLQDICSSSDAQKTPASVGASPAPMEGVVSNG